MLATPFAARGHRSAAGVAAGTAIHTLPHPRHPPAAVVVSFFFFLSLFLSPIIASIPPYATGPALVLVGTILLGHIAHIEWDDIGVAIPAFLTMVLMPFTYSGGRPLRGGPAQRETGGGGAIRARTVLTWPGGGAAHRRPPALAPPHQTPPHGAPPPAVAYGVIAGLISYLAIHAPFWLADFVRKRWWPTSGLSSPRSSRARRRSKTGYHMRKTFGPADDPPSRADSFVGGPWYDDSYRSQDSRRSALPISVLQAMGAGGPPGAASGAGLASLPNSTFPAPRSNPPSIVNMFFPEASVRGGGAGGSARGAAVGGYGRAGSHAGTAVRLVWVVCGCGCVTVVGGNARNGMAAGGEPGRVGGAVDMRRPAVQTLQGARPPGTCFAGRRAPSCLATGTKRATQPLPQVVQHAIAWTRCVEAGTAAGCCSACHQRCRAFHSWNPFIPCADPPSARGAAPPGGRPVNRSLTDVHGAAAPYGSSPQGGAGGGRASPPRFRQGLVRQMSIGTNSAGSTSPHPKLPPVRMGIARSRTFRWDWVRARPLRWWRAARHVACLLVVQPRHQRPGAGRRPTAQAAEQQRPWRRAVQAVPRWAARTKLTCARLSPRLRPTQSRQAPRRPGLQMPLTCPRRAQAAARGSSCLAT